ncbi:hypothetical protein FRC04_004051 [Tulasnella sp. 424]|nr:hypothetical protein FRC04_004051 [Tulasnella sp. 424]
MSGFTSPVSNASNRLVPAEGRSLDLTDDDDLRGPARIGWIVAVDGNGTVLGFVPKEADKLGNLPITIEIAEALVVRYVPPGTTCGAIEALVILPLRILVLSGQREREALVSQPVSIANTDSVVQITL